MDDNHMYVIFTGLVTLVVCVIIGALASNVDSIKNCSNSCGTDQMVSYTEIHQPLVARIPHCVCKDGCTK